MGICVLVYGKSGSGKTRSMKNFAEDEIFLIQVINKELPFRNKFKYHMVSDNVDTIIDQLNKMPCKTAVIDDAGYIMTDAFMRGHSAPKKGSSSFDLFNDIADTTWKLINAIKVLPPDVIVYYIMHEDTNDYGETRLKTIGKLLNEKVCIEGMVSVSIRCLSNGSRHYFRTQSDGSDISKSPEDMFELEIDNDLKMVDETIRNYWRLDEKEKENAEAK